MRKNEYSFSLASILALVCAILSFCFGAILGIVFAALALVFGIFGILLALAPKTRGGGISIIAVLLALVGVVAAVIKAIIWLISQL